MTVLDVQDIHKRFGGILAVGGVSLALRDGELLGLFGPNGAGKTTLFNVIAGVFPPNLGAVRLKGADITRFSAVRRARAGIGRTFQMCRPFRTLTVLGNVLASVGPGRGSHQRDVDAAMALLDDIGLASRANDPASQLTLGMLKRLEVARALALEPKVVLLDEPLAGLTAGEASDLLRFISSLKSRTSIILIDHNVRQSLTVCDRAIVLDAGVAIAEGTPDEIRADRQVRRAYLGEDGGSC